MNLVLYTAAIPRLERRERRGESMDVVSRCPYQDSHPFLFAADAILRYRCSSILIYCILYTGNICLPCLTGLLLGRVSHREGASPALAVSDARFLQLQRGCLGRLHEKLPDHWPRHSHLPGIWPWLRKELVCENSVSPQTALYRLFIP